MSDDRKPVPPPRASPVPGSNDPDDAQSDTPSGVYRIVQRTAWQTKIQWGALALALTATATAANSVWDKFTVLNTANAQATVRADTAVEVAREAKVHAQTVDAGARQAIERLERKIDANEDRAQRERAEDRALMQAVLREVKKR